MLVWLERLPFLPKANLKSPQTSRTSFNCLETARATCNFFGAAKTLLDCFGVARPTWDFFGADRALLNCFGMARTTCNCLVWIETF